MPAFLHNDEPRKSRYKRVTMGGSMAGLFTISNEQVRSYVENEFILNSEIGALCPSDSHRMLLLDCRSFLNYNENHVIGAINAHCPAILRRRSRGRLPLRIIIPNADVRESLMSGVSYHVVLYDEHCLSKNSRTVNEESTALFIAHCLQTETGLKSVYLMEGGFHQFSLLYPHLCTSSTPLSPRLPSSAPYTPKAVSLPKGSGVAGGEVWREQDEPVEILPYLYLGSAYHASCKSSLQHLNITALLNVSQTCPNHFEDSFTYKSIPVEDSGSEDIGVWFHEAICFIDTVKAQNGKVLVHCQAGVSRSATICMAYLMATKILRMEDAYEYVKSRRQVVSPNFSFLGQLLAFESRLFTPTVARSCKPIPSPRSPLLASVATTPDPDSLTPSHGAQQNVFDFTVSESPVTNLAPVCQKVSVS